jgi:ATP-dependent Lhr-like helicase
LFNKENLIKDIETGMNTIQLAGRKFREIAQIAGLIFNGYPGKEQKLRHIQASSKMFFDAFRNYEPNNLLYRQAIEEVLNDQLEFDRMNAALDAISRKKMILKKPEHLTPFCFPILAERIRNKLTTEKLEDKLGRIFRQRGAFGHSYQFA